MHRWRSLFAATVLLSSCAPAATQLVVVVDTDLAIPGMLDEVRVQVTGPSGTMETESARLATRGGLPLTVAVLAEDGESLGPVDVIASGYRDGTFVIDRAATVSLVRGETRVLSLFLLSNCVGVTCAEGQTCGDGGDCESEMLTTLPPWTGTPPRIGMDGGMMDAPGLDAPGLDAPGLDVPGLDAPRPDTPAVDGGPPCTGDADCDDGIACTVDSCTATGCTATPSNALCDDGNPCTDDVCGTTGCAVTNNTAPCPDGVYCNGTDVCSGGVCTHPGDPCVSPTVCDEAAGACRGCTSDTQCADTVGAWTSCDYVDGCDESANRSRTDLDGSCVSGSCVTTPRVITEACPARDTDGNTCGTGSCGGYGGCGGFSDACDESGVQTRTCTDLVCSAGSCSAAMRTESMGCSRLTGGTSCGPAACSPWGPCTYRDTCSTSGTQTRMCNDPICSGGSCGLSASRTESQSCGMRPTDGIDCGSTCGAYGACGGFRDVCDTSGTMSRTCSPRTCSGGVCTAGSDTVENTGCTRVTDGDTCDPDTCSSGYGSCSAGSCVGPSACGGDCICNNVRPFGGCYDPTPPYSICAIE